MLLTLRGRIHRQGYRVILSNTNILHYFSLGIHKDILLFRIPFLTLEQTHRPYLYELRIYL